MVRKEGDFLTEKRNEIVIFENQNVKLEVNMKDETVWLTQKQMAELFEKDRRTVTRHIQNIYKDGELDENSVCSFFEHTAKDGNKRIAATLFIYFLIFYGILYKENRKVIENDTLAALTLLIAESNPKEKEVIIDLVMNFLNE